MKSLTLSALLPGLAALLALAGPVGTPSARAEDAGARQSLAFYDDDLEDYYEDLREAREEYFEDLRDSQRKALRRARKRGFSPYPVAPYGPVYHRRTYVVPYAAPYYDDFGPYPYGGYPSRGIDIRIGPFGGFNPW